MTVTVYARIFTMTFNLKKKGHCIILIGYIHRQNTEAIPTKIKESFSIDKKFYTEIDLYRVY